MPTLPEDSSSRQADALAPAATPSFRDSPPQPPSRAKNLLAEGHYAAMGERGLVVAVKIERPNEGKFKHTTFMLSKSRRRGWHHAGSKRPNGRYIGVYGDIFKAVAADPLAAAEKIASDFGICWCGGPTADAELHRPCRARLLRTLA